MAAPVMTPPGAGFVQNPAMIEPAAFPQEVVPIRKNSLWTDGNANLIRLGVRAEFKDEVPENVKAWLSESGIEL